MNKRTNTHVRSQRGFNLVELMVAVAVVGILGMVAYPSFLDSVRQSRRTDAHTALMLASNNLERFFAANNTYTTDTSAIGFDVDGGVSYSEGGHYTVAVAAGSSGIASSYVVTVAAASGDGQQQDTGCTSLTIDSTGRRTPDPNTSDCW